MHLYNTMGYLYKPHKALCPIGGESGPQGSGRHGGENSHTNHQTASGVEKKRRKNKENKKVWSQFGRKNKKTCLQNGDKSLIFLVRPAKEYEMGVGEDTGSTKGRGYLKARREIVWVAEGEQEWKRCYPLIEDNTLIFLVRPARIELAAYCLGGNRSILLSYERMGTQSAQTVIGQKKPEGKAGLLFNGWAVCRFPAVLV